MSRREAVRKGAFEDRAEAEAWRSLYPSREPGGRRRYAIFQAHAQSRARSRARLALQLLNPRAGSAVLDAGCGVGAFREAVLSCGASWIGVDRSMEMLRTGQLAERDGSRPAIWVNASLERLPFGDETFDAVLCIGVLNLFPWREQAIVVQQLRRVLRPGGALVLTSLRRDVLTWVRSRLPHWVPRPIRSPGPIYPTHHRRVLHALAGSGFACAAMVPVRKYLGLPHYTMLRLDRLESATSP